MTSTRITSNEPDPNALSFEQRQRIMQLISEAASGLKGCEVCNSNLWSLNERIVSPALLEPIGAYLHPDYTRIHPCALMQCTRCGNSKYLSLTILKFDPFEEAAP